MSTTVHVGFTPVEDRAGERVLITTSLGLHWTVWLPDQQAIIVCNSCNSLAVKAAHCITCFEPFPVVHEHPWGQFTSKLIHEWVEEATDPLTVIVTGRQLFSKVERVIVRAMTRKSPTRVRDDAYFARELARICAEGGGTL